MGIKKGVAGVELPPLKPRRTAKRATGLVKEVDLVRSDVSEFNPAYSYPGDSQNYNLATSLLEFQALTAPTMRRANMGVTVVINFDLPWVTPPHFSPGDSKIILPQGVTEYTGVRCTIFHEMTHALEHFVPEISEQALAILKSRGNKGKFCGISFIHEFSSKFSPIAVGIRDHFLNPYTGRLYVDYKPSVCANEVSTTSMDQLAYGATALSLLLSDPDLFSHALAICYGTYFDS